MKAMKKMIAGFSLTEGVLVLVVVGAVLAGVWTATSSVQKKNRIDDAIKVIVEVGENARKIYAGQRRAPSPNMANMIQRGMFPSHVVTASGTATANTWGGSYGANFVRTGVASDLRGILVSMTLSASSIGLLESQETCITVVQRLQGTGKNVGSISALSTSTPTYNPAQGSGPTNVFVGNIDVTGFTVQQIISSFSAGHCTQVQAYYPF